MADKDGASRDSTGPVGLLLVDKPTGPTSHDIVGRLRAILGTRRVGHAGTLDPMATGLLVLAVGRATKLLGHLALTDKSYHARIRLGQTTVTDDADGEISSHTGVGQLAEADIDSMMTKLRGDIMQVPSSVSAIKVAGRRAYDRVRDGEDVRLRERPVTVSRFERVGPIQSDGDCVEFDVAVDCSTGTYVRALARDLGDLLGVGGHLTILRRTTVGPFDSADAVDVYPGGPPPRRVPGERPQHPPITDALRDSVAAQIVPVSSAVSSAFHTRTLDEGHRIDLRYGRPIPAAGRDGVYACLDSSGDLVALVEDRQERAYPVFVWQAAS